VVGVQDVDGVEGASGRGYWVGLIGNITEFD